ncbi:hypothetical protein, partial [Mycobacterium tuberculosis]|uniref:hypothetical protein n=1 Tax=Mycobacterium tuberculosis TaxID=1773 RepID=UPI000AB7E501
MSVKSKNGRLAARVLVALAALFAMIALTGSACLAEGPPLGREPPRHVRRLQFLERMGS